MTDERLAYENLINQARTSGIAGCATDRPCKVPLMEQLQKTRCSLIEKLERQDRLIEMLREHPEIEVIQDFQDLLRSKREGW